VSEVPLDFSQSANVYRPDVLPASQYWR